ncbi:MAG: sensor histidine kinase [Anaerolineales bacterium]|nr:sensor histidine kinase [Anaerolineales bacterium]
MTIAHPATEDAEHELPLPLRQFRWYLLFWHIVYLGILGSLWAATLWAARTALGWREAALTALAAGQTALYLWNFMLNDRWPLPGWRHATYFGGSIVLWLIEWWLYQDFAWLGMAYFGQMFGVLPPLAAVLGTLFIFVLVFGQDGSLDFSRVTSGAFIGPLLGWTSAIVFYLFVYYVMRTSARRGKLVDELRSAQAELEAARARDAELAALQERERLARDLHDSLGHALVSISVQLEAIQRLYRVDPERAAEQVEALKGVTRAAMDELRRSLEGLRTPGLGERPLAEALRALSVETGARSGLEVSCHVAGEAQRLSPPVAEALWRVAQEALTNVARHARAQRVEVRLEVAPTAAVLRVHDDGRGLANGADGGPGHYGLQGLRERLEGVGGELSVRSEGGVAVEARVPLL